MGRERKRGKLADLNALLRGRAGAGVGDRFSLIVGDAASLRAVRYVITLDTDTQLPRDAARQLVATMAHPLNRPRLGGSGAGLRVVGGHGILQPRVGISLPSAGRSRYARLFAGDLGIDPYTRAVSDVYQDLFGEGSFIGKGIYDVDAFERVMGERLPQNRILSHDLLEGCYARSGLVSDVQLVEESPARYDADADRRHRWIRGDWQVLGWLMPIVRVPAAEPADGGGQRKRDTWVRNPLSGLSRLKIADNLRRSLTPAALSLLFLSGWTVLPSPWVWTLAGLAIVASPPLIAALANLLRTPDELPFGRHLGAVVGDLDRQLRQVTLALACLPSEAVFSLDAVVRTITRLWITRRRLLQWQSSSVVAQRTAPVGLADLWRTVRRMWAGPAFALGAAAAIIVINPPALWPATPLLILWLLSPAIVWWVSQPLQHGASSITAEQARDLRVLARRTWAFFETHVGADDNFLPPDNMQEQPVRRIAHRTSPTNIGLSLLSTLSAFDFGYLTLGQLIDRTRATLDAMDRLETYHGHFFNWYDTRSLQPLRPHYVSTVDSGNLVGHLVTLRAGLQLLASAPPQRLRLLDGLADTLRLLQQATGPVPAGAAQTAFATRLDQALASPQQAIAAWGPLLAALSVLAGAIARQVESAPDASMPDPEPERAEARLWARALQAQCDAAALEWSLDAPAADRAEPSGERSAVAHAARSADLLELAGRIERISRMDFGLVYDPARSLLVIGYNVDDQRSDAGHYDLLASEARLASFVAIAQGQVPQSNWFALGRLLTTVDGRAALLSWSGSMFEYLMPSLVMPSYPDTLLDQTLRAAVSRQIGYGRQRDVPWGVSESGYNATDANLNYQYRAFGVPGLGLKRGLSEDLVVAPYASVMALMIEPLAACQNLARLRDLGLAGTFGYYEAIDYTPSRLTRGQTSMIVRSYMAHHQGMSLLSLAHVLLGQPMQRRFESDPEVQATLLLLQERIPKVAAFHPQTVDPVSTNLDGAASASSLHLITTADTPAPEVQLLSNGRYHVMVTNAGAGVQPLGGSGRDALA